MSRSGLGINIVSRLYDGALKGMYVVERTEA